MVITRLLPQAPAVALTMQIQMRKHITDVSVCYMNITRLSLFMNLEGPFMKGLWELG